VVTTFHPQPRKFCVSTASKPTPRQRLCPSKFKISNQLRLIQDLHTKVPSYIIHHIQSIRSSREGESAGAPENSHVVGRLQDMLWDTHRPTQVPAMLPASPHGRTSLISPVKLPNDPIQLLRQFWVSWASQHNGTTARELHFYIWPKCRS
jgi:hypothetical protein